MEAGPAADAGYHQQAGQDGAPSPDVAAHHLAYEHQLVAEGQVQQAAAEQDYVAHDQQDYAAHAAAANGDLEFDPNEETGVMDQGGHYTTQPARAQGRGGWCRRNCAPCTAVCRAALPLTPATAPLRAAGNPITVGQVDEAATKGDEWTHDEEITLLSLMTNEEYRKVGHNAAGGVHIPSCEKREGLGARSDVGRCGGSGFQTWLCSWVGTARARCCQ